MTGNPLAEAGARRRTETEGRYLTRWQIALYEAILISAVVGSAWFDLWLSRLMIEGESVIFDVLRGFEDMGDSQWFLVTASCWMLGCLMLLRLTGRPETRLRLHWLIRGQAYLIACIALSGILANIFKIIFGRARPSHLDAGLTADWSLFAFNWGWQSFPSGHTTTLFTAAFALGVLFPKARLFLFGCAVLGGLGRIAIGAHFLSDVIAGAALGTFTAWWLQRFLARRSAPVGPFPA
ncbi:phosphatase PAP2 family protein [Minwuia sp.]|uniref:phosphatase PAP2 family protein n=1 Tax=Minwuia sp. TaxID=2493630 RepID=UPI003A8D1D43